MLYNARIGAQAIFTDRADSAGAVMIEQAVIDGIVERVVKAAQPQKVILFGSAARGDMDRHSDLDFLVIIRDDEDLNEVEQRIYAGLRDKEVPVDVIIASTSTIARYKHSHALVYKPALREGKVMYESPNQEMPPDPDDLPPEEYPPGRYAPDDSREWLTRAKSNLAYAKSRPPDVLFEDMCYSAQQAAEKAIKARLIALDVEFSYTHEIKRLLMEVEAAGDAIPDEVRMAEGLTRYAITTRYPWGPGRGPRHPDPIARVTEDQYLAAIRAAEAVVDWVERAGL